MNLERWGITLGTIFVIVVYGSLIVSCNDCEGRGGIYARTFGGGYECIEGKENK
jgi:hypothetical protein